MAKITTRDIARMAGVSPTAVSFALNGKEGISPQTREKIISLAQKLGYAPTARNRRTRDPNLRYNRIAVVSERKDDVDFLFSEFHSSVLNRFLSLCSKNDIDVVIANIPSIAGEFRIPNTLMFEDIDAVLILSEISHLYLDKIRSMNLPLLEFNVDYSYPGQKAVHLDFHHAVCMATQHLLDLGHRDIAYFGSNENRDAAQGLFTGFCETMSSVSQPLDLRRIQMNLSGKNAVVNAVNIQLSVKPCPTAILCTTGNLAIETIDDLHKRGIRVPEDISVVSISDISHSKYSSPSLSAVHIDSSAIAQLMFNSIMKLINGEALERTTYVPTEFIHGESSIPLNQTKTQM